MTKQLFLRTTDANGKSYGGFQWPMEIGATVEAPDWDATPECGNGLHGLLNGEGYSGHLSFDDDAIWWIVEAEGAVDRDGKHKFPRCIVVAFGTRFEIANEMKRLTGAAVHGCNATSGDYGTSTSGHGGTSTSGDYGTSTSGYGGISTSGDGGTSTSGYRGISTSGYGGTSTSGYGGISTSGYGGTSTSGHRGTSTSGDVGTSTSGHGGTSTSGDYGTSTSGYGGISTSGDGGTIVFTRRFNGRLRFLVGYVGEDGIKPNVAYRASDDFTKIIEAK